MDCCERCGLFEKSCQGCEKTNGHPCGGSCVAAECVRAEGKDALAEQKRSLIERINSMKIKNLHIDDLCLLNGAYVNLEYTLPNGEKIKLLKNDRVYWGTQTEIPDSDRCFGVAADDRYILICEYGCNGSEPEIISYTKR